MFEVLLAALSGLVFGYGVTIWVRGATLQQDFSPVTDLGERIDMIEGKLTLVLDRIEEAMDEIEPPSVAEHITGAFSAWFQNKMLRDQVGILGGTILEPPQPQGDSWPDVEPVQSAPESVLKNQ